MGRLNVVRCAALCCAVWTLGCAQGVPAPELTGVELVPNAGQSAPAMLDAGPAGPPPQPPLPVFTGEACMMGQTGACVCTDGTSMGRKACKADGTSPTGGAFGPCEMCMAPPPPPPPPPPPDAGTGTGGSGGGTGGTTGGTGGRTGGTGGSGACNPAQCPRPPGLFGLPGPMPCCRSNGTCGALGLLGCA